MPLQAIWAAAMPYCQHEGMSSQARHLGHHQHQAHGDLGGAVADAHGESESAKGLGSLDHDHHCWSFVSLLPDAQGLPVPPQQTQSVSSPLAVYSSFDSHRIERPNWSVSL